MTHQGQESTKSDGITRFYVPGKSCPRCKGRVISDGRHVWCEQHLPRHGYTGCQYGTDMDVLLESI